MEHDDFETKAVVGPMRPVFQTWVTLGARVADEIVRAGCEGARDVHGEWKDRLAGSLDLLRKLSGRVDGVVEEVVASAEGLRGLVQGARRTAADATDVAARTGAAWVGDGTTSSEAA